MKKLINRPADVVKQMLEGFVATAPDTRLAADANVIMRADIPAPPDRKVAVISGGGSGHEPAHAGFVGRGMLTAAVVGEVFTSPDVDTILATILATAGPAGALLIVKNYTGDRLNFGLAADLAREQGVPTRMVIVADDVALRDRVAPERRRGIAGTVLVHKVAGQAAENGADLNTVASLAGGVASGVRSMGVALGSCTVPASGQASFALAEDEIEFGLGIHGERGLRRAPMACADDIVAALLDELLLDYPACPESGSVLLVNGLGGTPQMELHIAVRAALSQLQKRGVSVRRVMVGSLMTAMEMPGLSITLLPLESAWTALLDASTSAQAWPGVHRYESELRRTGFIMHDVQLDIPDGPPCARLKAAVEDVAGALKNAEAFLSDLDAKAGDGDLGSNLSKGASALLGMDDRVYTSPGGLLAAMSQTLRRAIGGSSGPLYAAGLLRAAAVVRQGDETDPLVWADALEAAASAISELGGARSGDRTMLDALVPAAKLYRKRVSDGTIPAMALSEAASQAVKSANDTAAMAPAQGRASYLGGGPLGIADAGAVAVVIWMEALAESLSNKNQ